MNKDQLKMELILKINYKFAKEFVKYNYKNVKSILLNRIYKNYEILIENSYYKIRMKGLDFD